MSAVKQVRANMKDDWDVAPMLVYKEYNDDGTEVLVHGVQAAHSGSVGIALNAKTKKANAAFLFASYIASEFGQSIQADEGFAIPLQKSIANSEVYLKPGTKPANIKVFIDACYYEGGICVTRSGLTTGQACSTATCVMQKSPFRTSTQAPSLPRRRVF